MRLFLFMERVYPFGHSMSKDHIKAPTKTGGISYPPVFAFFP